MPRRTLSTEEEERIVGLHTEGRNSNQIAKEMNLAYQTVYRRVQKLKAAEEQSGNGVEAETQGAETLAIKPPAGRKGSRTNGAGAAATALTHISTREAYQGELLTFIHDLSEKTVSIELNGQEPMMRFKADAFMMFARDVELMKTLLSDMNTSNTTEKAE